ncbi:MAG TPA: hypothetical protein VFO69_00260 [Allosphingosinicella sp.]|nr:hypothetical protein [Allosphingosinicella sp.]
MVRKFVSATVSAALCIFCIVPSAAMAQDYRFTGFDAPKGATATLNLRVPMGRQHARRASYGLTLGYGQEMGPIAFDGRTTSRAVNVADIRFSGDRLRSARVAGFDLANLDRDRRLNLTGGGIGSTGFIIGAIAAGALICFVITDCFDDDDDEAVPN